MVLRPEILEAGQRALSAAHPGARFQYVFHGSSGSSERELADAISFGAVTVNVDTDNQYAFTRAVAGHVLDHWQGVLKVDGGIGDKHSFDPRAWGRAGEAAMAERVRQACEQLGSAGRSLGAGQRSGRRAVDPPRLSPWVWARRVRASRPVERFPCRGTDNPLALIAGAYRPFGQSCCGTGERAASLGAQALSRATPDLRSADLHLPVVGPQYRKAIACPTSGTSCPTSNLT